MTINGLAYPGIGAKFDLVTPVEGNHDKSCKLQRQYSYISTIPDSFISRVSLLTYTDRTIALAVAAGCHSSAYFQNFLSYNELVGGIATDFCYIATDLSEIECLFKILQENNQFPPKELDFLSKTIAAAAQRVLVSRIGAILGDEPAVLHKESI